jgi:hypothetical protein
VWEYKGGIIELLLVFRRKFLQDFHDRHVERRREKDCGPKCGYLKLVVGYHRSDLQCLTAVIEWLPS